MKKKEIIQTAIVLVIAIFMISTIITFATGSDRTMVVLSGSMTPMMLPGDMIIVESISPGELMVGDVIAFQDPGGKETFVTHRIVNIKEYEERIFKTKGDANEEEDFFEVPASDVIGKLIFVIPFAGYLPEASKNKTFFLLTVMLPAVIIILDEIRKMIIYSNPTRARKIEREKKKVSKHISYVIKGNTLLAILLLSGFFFTGVVINNLGENGPTILQKENEIVNSGFLPSVCVLIPEEPEQRLAIKPWYAVISPNEKIQVTSPEGTPANISSVPYILPVFWIISLAELNPYYPAVGELVLYISVFTLLLSPLWYLKTIAGRKIKRTRFSRLLIQWKRTLHLKRIVKNPF